MRTPANATEKRKQVSYLLVEDSDFDRKRIARMVEISHEVTVYGVPTIAEARVALEARSFDLILLDNALPDGLGVDFAVKLRNDPRFAKIPILMISDHPTPFIYDKAMTARISRVLTKDEFNPKHLAEALRAARLKERSKP